MPLDSRLRGNERSIFELANKLYVPVLARRLSARANQRPSASKPTAAITNTGTAVKRSKMSPLIATPSVCPR